MRPPKEMRDSGRDAWETSWQRMKAPISNHSSLNAPYEKNLTQTGAPFDLMSGKTSACDNPMKAPKSGLQMEVAFDPLELYVTRLSWLW